MKGGGEGPTASVANQKISNIAQSILITYVFLSKENFLERKVFYQKKISYNATSFIKRKFL